MITVQSERLSDVIPDVSALLEKHYREICSHPDELILDPNWAHYLALEDLGMLDITTARDGRELIGYACCLVLCHPHYQQNVFAFNDVIYLDSSRRMAGTGNRLLEHMEQSLTARGVEWLHMHVKLAHDFGPLLERRGYVCTERNFEKRLKETN